MTKRICDYLEQAEVVLDIGDLSRAKLIRPGGFKTLAHGLTATVDVVPASVSLNVAHEGKPIARYELQAQPMPPLSTHRGRHYCKWHIVDTLQNPVRKLYLFRDRLGSRFELELRCYNNSLSHFPEVRHKRKQAKLLQPFPSPHHSILLDPKRDVTRLISMRPFYTHRAKFIERVIKIRHGLLHRGDKEKRDGEITATHMKYWALCDSRKKGLPASWYRTLAPLNQMRREVLEAERLEAEPLPLGYRTT